MQSLFCTVCTVGRLVAAVGASNVGIGLELLDFDADIDIFGRTYIDQPNGPEDIARTPLQLAASEGNYSLVELK